MKVLFISTDFDLWALGLRSISAVLKQAGYSTQLIFMPSRTRFYAQKALEALAPFVKDADVVGFSCLARGSDRVEQLIDSIRPMKKMTVWGGVHASLNPNECAAWANIVCRGEGEGMMLDLLESLQNGTDWRSIPNIVFCEDGEIHINPPRPPIENLDDLPLPDFSFENEYHLVSDQLVQAFTIPEVKERGSIYFNGSRGCAFYCTYCCNEKIKGIYAGKQHYVRRMSIPRLIEHAGEMKKIFPQGKYFYFLDEDFAARPMRELEQFAQEYPQSVGLKFECLAHPARITISKMDLLVRAGIWRINMGIESGSERTRDEVYDRHVPNIVIKNAAEIISKYPQVVPYYFLIIANPYEERQDLLETARFLRELPQGWYLTIYNLVFFPGSSLFERAVKDGLIQGAEDSGYEMDYLSGLNYKTHPWKSKNLGLNGLIFLMAGKITRHRMGLLPRFLLDALLRPEIITFNEHHTSLIKFLISIKSFANALRHLAARQAKKIISDPTVIYSR